MAFTSNSGGGPMADINVTPLVDVMLVLLIIFMITAPLMSHKIKVELPQANLDKKATPKNPPEPIRIHIDAGGTISWNGSPTPLSTLQSQFDVEGQRPKDEQPTIEIDTDKDAEYDTLAKVLSRAKNADLVKISFVQPGE